MPLLVYRIVWGFSKGDNLFYHFSRMPRGTATVVVDCSTTHHRQYLSFSWTCVIVQVVGIQPILAGV